MGMGAGRRKRQVVLFVTAIVLPAAGLIGLAARIIGLGGSWPASEPATNGETRSSNCGANWQRASAARASRC